MIKLVVALGNPGPEYELTKHNIGWLALDNLSFYDDLSWKKKFKGLFTTFNVNGEQRYFLKPQTYMNLSGESVGLLAGFFKIDPSEILVIHDDMDLEFGKIVFKNGGGLAGHNGLKSISKILGTNDYKRVRMGIGRPENMPESNWVTSSFSKEQETLLGEFLIESAKAIESALKHGFQKAASLYSRVNIQKKTNDDD